MAEAVRVRTEEGHVQAGKEAPNTETLDGLAGHSGKDVVQHEGRGLWLEALDG